jgi:LPXTG-motif cell wall-anchored protein
MSGGGVVLGASTTAAGVAILPDTGGSRLVFFVAAGILTVGIITLGFSGAMILKKKMSGAK